MTLLSCSDISSLIVRIVFHRCRIAWLGASNSVTLAMSTTALADSGGYAGDGIWPSLEAASRIFDISSFVLIGALIIGAIATGLIVRMGAVKERHWDNLRDESRLKIATLESETAAAKADLGRANAEIARAHESTANLQKTTADARAHTVALEVQLELERQKRAPRVLTDEQREILVAELKGKLSRVTVAVQADLESRAFAQQLYIAFSEAGVGISPFDLPPGDLHVAPAGLMMYRPGGAVSEDDMKDDPLYKALKRANLFGGFTSKPFARLTFDVSSLAQPLIPWAGHVVYVGQKQPW